jgi:membrane-associated phospholipid phosphatase
MLRVPAPAPELRLPRTLVTAAQLAVRPDRRNVLFWSSWGLALGFELAMVSVLWGGDIYGWEQDVTRAFQAVPAHTEIRLVSSFLTNTLSVPFVLMFAAIAVVVARRGEAAGALVLLVSFPVHVLSQFPKFFFERPRPSEEFEGIVGIGGLNSFPSGHSEYVVSFYGFLAYLAIIHLPSRAQKWAVGAAFVAFAMTVGFGRIAGGRHWPVDVLTSYVIGLGVLSGLIWLHSSWRRATAEALPAGASVVAFPTLTVQDAEAA